MWIVVSTGWVALAAFIAMLVTCVCAYGCEHCLAEKTRTKKDDRLVNFLHRIHKYFVWIAVIAISIHVVLSLTR